VRMRTTPPGASSPSNGACPGRTPSSPSVVRAMTMLASPDQISRSTATNSTCRVATTLLGVHRRGGAQIAGNHGSGDGSSSTIAAERERPCGARSATCRRRETQMHVRVELPSGSRAGVVVGSPGSGPGVPLLPAG
jgi:hypothetical protein